MKTRSQPQRADDGRRFSGWMMGVGIAWGLAAVLLGPIVLAGSVLAAWVAIAVSLSIYRTRLRLAIGLISGAALLWPWYWSWLVETTVPVW